MKRNLVEIDAALYDPDSGLIINGKDRHQLTPSARAILNCLIEHRGFACSLATLNAALGMPQTKGRSAATHMMQIRSKLPAGCITSAYGIGYRLRDQNDICSAASLREHNLLKAGRSTCR